MPVCFKYFSALRRWWGSLPYGCLVERRRRLSRSATASAARRNGSMISRVDVGEEDRPSMDRLPTGIEYREEVAGH